MASFSSVLPVRVYVRPAGSSDDWQDFDEGPGYFNVPEDHEVQVRVRTIDDAQLTQLIKELEEAREVTYVNLSENRGVTDAGIGKLTKLSWLTHLNLSSCDLGDHALTLLAAFTKLRWLDLSYCNRITDKGIRSLEALRRLEYLSLQGVPKVTHAAVAHLERRGLTIYKPSKGQRVRPSDK